MQEICSSTLKEMNFSFFKLSLSTFHRGSGTFSKLGAKITLLETLKASVRNLHFLNFHSIKPFKAQKVVYKCIALCTKFCYPWYWFNLPFSSSRSFRKSPCDVSQIDVGLHLVSVKRNWYHFFSYNGWNQPEGGVVFNKVITQPPDWKLRHLLTDCNLYSD